MRNKYELHWQICYVKTKAGPHDKDIKVVICIRFCLFILCLSSWMVTQEILLKLLKIRIKLIKELPYSNFNLRLM